MKPLPILALLTLMLIAVAAPAQTPEAAPPKWDAQTLGLFASLPIQDEGRIKPLDTYAAFKLLKLNGRRSCKTPDGRTLTSLEWLLDCTLFPETAETYPVFSVATSDVIVALGLIPHEQKRDRYSYRELEPARGKLFSLSDAYGRLPAKDRTTVQTQLVNLAHNLMEYEAIVHYADFARQPIKLPASESIARLFPDQTDARLSAVLAKASALHDEFRSTKKDANAEAQKKDHQAITELLGALDEVRKTAHALALFPPVNPDDKEWMTPADVVMRAFESGARAAAAIKLLDAFETLVQQRGDPDAFRETAAAFHTAIVQIATQRGEYGKINLEVAFYKGQFFSHSLECFVFAFLLVAVTWLLPRNRILPRIVGLLLTVATLLLIVGITMRCIIRGRPPVTTLYETILFTTAVAVVVSLFIEYVNRQRVALAVGTVLGVVGMFLANKYEVSEGVDTMPSMVAVLDTNFWLATHVTTIAMGYGAGMLSGALAHIYILGRLLGLKKNDPKFYDNVTRMVYGVFCFGFFFSFLGTLLGGVWASESWGRFWGWDPKENGALLICLWQLATLHARTGGYIRDLGLHVAAVCCGMVVAFSWWGVNLLGVGLHSYGFTSGTMNSLLAFWIVETVVVILGIAIWTRKDSTTRPPRPKSAR